MLKCREALQWRVSRHFVSASWIKPANFSCVTGPVLRLSAVLARGPVSVLATGVLELAAYAEQLLAAASGPALPDLVAEERLGLVSGCFLHPGAVAEIVARPDRHVEAALNAEYPAASDFLFEALLFFPVEQVRVLFVLLAAESADGLFCHAAGNDNARVLSSAADLCGADICPLNTAAGREATGHAPEQSFAATCPIPFDVAPIHVPSADPSGAAHRTASRESTWEAAGSSARGSAG